MTVHWNSISSYSAVLPSIGQRHQEIIDILEDTSMTDRQIAEALGYSDLNAVRPRITELVQGGILRECGTTTCETTGRPVRLVLVVAAAQEVPVEEEPAETTIPESFTSPMGRVTYVRQSEFGFGVVFAVDDGTCLYFPKRDVDGLIDRLIQLTEEEE